MVGQLLLDETDGSTGVVAPSSAILRRQGRLSVFVVEERDGELHAVLRGVRVGRQRGALVELIDGVSVGDRVVVDGLFALTDGAAVYLDGVPVRGETAWND
jgi:membrane fusion protein (multidrug efflux system)